MAARKTSAAAAPAVRQRRVPSTKTAVASAAGAAFFLDGLGKNVLYIHSGAALLNAALGGGWALGRVSNLVGDKSAGKTLLAMEAMANLLLQYPNALARYAETESAWDGPYAQALGIPVDRIELNPKGTRIGTVEEWYEDLKKFLAKCREQKVHGIYVLDSLDALSDAAEMDKDFDEGSYGGAKPKAIGKLFRMLVDEIEQAGVHLLIVSQIRDKLNVTFGETKTRSGGRALDFYASQIMWIAEVKKLKRTVNGIERIVGVQVEGIVKKNKVGLPHRRAQYPILFGYGVDDMTASVEWLVENKRGHLLKEFDLTEKGYAISLRAMRDRGGDEVNTFRKQLADCVTREWADIERDFFPKASKY